MLRDSSPPDFASDSDQLYSSAGSSSEASDGSGLNALFSRTIFDFSFWAHIFPVGGNPVGSDIVLSGRQVHRSRANQLMKSLFQCVFETRIPASRVRLRPQITGGFGAAQIRSNKVVNFVLARLRRSYSVGRKNGALNVLGNVAPYHFRICPAAYLVETDRLGLAGRNACPGERTCDVQRGFKGKEDCQYCADGRRKRQPLHPSGTHSLCFHRKARPEESAWPFRR